METATSTTIKNSNPSLNSSGSKHEKLTKLRGYGSKYWNNFRKLILYHRIISRMLQNFLTNITEVNITWKSKLNINNPFWRTTKQFNRILKNMRITFTLSKYYTMELGKLRSHINYTTKLTEQQRAYHFLIIFLIEHSQN